MSPKLIRILTIVLLAGAALLITDCNHTAAPTDAQVSSDIQGKLTADQAVQNKQIAVLAANGVVTLSGSVASEAERNAASSDAAAVSGVRTVVNNLTVQSAEAPATPEAPQPATAVAPPPPAPVQPPARRHEPAYQARRAHKPSAARLREASQEYAQENQSYSQADAMRQQSNEDQTADQPEPAPSAPPEPAAEPEAAPAPQAAPAPPPPPATVTIPYGTPLAIRMMDTLNSETANPGDTFRATLNAPIVMDGRVVIPVNADLYGRVVEAQSAGRFKGSALLSIQLTRIGFNGRYYHLQTELWSQQTQGRGKNTAEKVGGGAGLGALIGALAGGGKGAGIGAIVGAGAGGVAQGVTHGKQVVLGPESLLTFHLARSLTVQPSSRNEREAGRQQLY